MLKQDERPDNEDYITALLPPQDIPEKSAWSDRKAAPPMHCRERFRGFVIAMHDAKASQVALPNRDAAQQN